MHLICPECKNNIDFSSYPHLVNEQVIECDICGITLLVTHISDSGTVCAEIVDEGK